jgi:hypothetical protein
MAKLNHKLTILKPLRNLTCVRDMARNISNRRARRAMATVRKLKSDALLSIFGIHRRVFLLDM